MSSIAIFTAALFLSPLDPLIDKLENTEYMTGSFVQTDFWALTLEEEVSSGIMHLARPDLFRLCYDDPAGAETGYDGSVLYTVEPDIGQVMVYGSREPESFLHLLEQCGDSTICRVTDQDPDTMVVELEGDFGQGIGSMEVGFCLSDSLPFLFSTTDFNGNTTTYRISGIVTSGTVPEGVFLLRIPEGFELVDPEGV